MARFEWSTFLPLSNIVWYQYFLVSSSSDTDIEDIWVFCCKLLLIRYEIWWIFDSFWVCIWRLYFCYLYWNSWYIYHAIYNIYFLNLVMNNKPNAFSILFFFLCIFSGGQANKCAFINNNTKLVHRQ